MRKRRRPSTDGAIARAFNIKAESLRLGDFSKAKVRALLGQHSRETEQVITDGAMAGIRELPRGQPWLVNALAYEACCSPNSSATLSMRRTSRCLLANSAKRS